jgi:hypothetical protein
MKHFKEATEIFEKIVNYCDVDNDKEEVSEILKEKGITVESIAKDIETGVNSGYSVDEQMAIINLIIKKLI